MISDNLAKNVHEHNNNGRQYYEMLPIFRVKNKFDISQTILTGIISRAGEPWRLQKPFWYALEQVAFSFYVHHECIVFVLLFTITGEKALKMYTEFQETWKTGIALFSYKLNNLFKSSSPVFASLSLVGNYGLDGRL